MAVQFPDLGKSIKDASALASTKMSLKKYSEEAQNKKNIKEARSKAIDDGTPKAIKVLMKLDPEGANDIIKGLSMMDEKQREDTKFVADETARQMTWVMSAPPEERSQRWDTVVDGIVSMGNTEAEKYKGNYSPDIAQSFLMKAMTIEDINEQFSFGGLRVAEKDGKPVYIQTNEAGQVREAPVPKGVGPTEKEAKGTAKGGGSALKASDANSITKIAAGLYGGITDPVTGEIKGIDPDKYRNALAIATLAEKKLSESRSAGEGMLHNEAVAAAAKELGIPIPEGKLTNVGEKKDSGKKTGGRSIRDYLNDMKD